MKYLALTALAITGLLVSCASNGTKESSFTPINSIAGYKLSDFNLSKSIKFFKLRTYEYSDTDKHIVGEYLDTSLWGVPIPAGGWYTTYDRDIYKTLSEKELSAFHALKAKIPNNGKIIHYSYGGGSNHSVIADNPYPKADILFYIDNNGKAGVVNSKDGLQRFLGNIDTDAEIAMILWSEFLSANCYKKMTNGYELYTGSSKIFMDTKGNISKPEKLEQKPAPCK